MYQCSSLLLPPAETRPFLSPPTPHRSKKAYNRIAGYFSSSMLEVAGEALETVSILIRVMCNSDLDVRDVETAKAASYALRREWCASEGMLMALYGTRPVLVLAPKTDERDL